MASEANWVAADWGTTHLRVWHMNAGGEARAEARSDKGMAALDAGGFEPALLDLIEPWLKPGEVVDVVACGMVGARQGWIEAEYSPVPVQPLTSGAFKLAPCNDGRLRVSIIPGLMQNNPADVMRGEETQIAGFLAEFPDFDGTICMPGTHTKWVAVAAGAVRRFASSMTGELFSLISEHSVLKHSVSDDNIDSPSFVLAARSALASDPPGLANLFSIRADDLLHGRSQAEGRGKLSGMLIGSEVAGRREWLDGQLAVLGEPALAGLYEQVLGMAGVSAESFAAGDLTLKGLRAAYALLQNERNA